MNTWHEALELALANKKNCYSFGSSDGTSGQVYWVIELNKLMVVTSGIIANGLTESQAKLIIKSKKSRG
jgi:hypothetical protein